MENSNHWAHEAANNLSSGFTRNESIKMLIDDGLNPVVAEEEVDKLIKKSFLKGLGELGLGILALLIGGIGFISIIVGIVIIGDGLRRIGTLLVVTKPYQKFKD